MGRPKGQVLESPVELSRVVGFPACMISRKTMIRTIMTVAPAGFRVATLGVIP